MRRVLSLIIVFLLTFVFPPEAHAIIFLPVVVLIPIAKIVALIIGGFTIPALGIGALGSKLFKKSLKRTVSIVIFICLLLAVILAIVFKIHNPERPLF